MVAPRLRSNSLAKKIKKTPGGKKVTHHRKKSAKAAKCAECGRALLGVPRSRTSKLARSKRVPNRPFGGNLCSICTRSALKKQIRG